MKRLFGLCLALFVLAGTAGGQNAPAWRGKHPGTAYLGDDVLWRPREHLTFHMVDGKGTGFDLRFTVRDMNIYMQGPRAVFFWVVAPDGSTLVREWMEDDGVVSGNAQYHDGIYDTWQDFRYREWHRVHSPGGYPLGKKRSPYLAHPETLPARVKTITVPAAGKGLYRVCVQASWDHWISITPDRPLMTGVHPGRGPIYVHGNIFETAYIYAAPYVKDLGFTLNEEVQPFGWTVSVEDEAGKPLGTTMARSFLSHMTVKAATPGAVYKLSVKGTLPGCNLHIGGTPQILCPDAETARAIHGGCEKDDKGRVTFHENERVLNRYADSLTPAALAVEIEPPAKEALAKIADKKLRKAVQMVPKLLAEQNLDPTSPDYGKIEARGGRGILARAAGTKHPANPYYGHPGIVRRVFLNVLPRLRTMTGYFRYEEWIDRDGGWEAKDELKSVFDTTMRSNWYFLGREARHAYAARDMKSVMADALPAEVIAAWKRNLLMHAGSRWNMHVGEVTNQWSYTLEPILAIYEFTGEEAVAETIRRHCRIMTTPGALGRGQPDPTPYSTRSSVAHTYAVDLGMTGAGYLADGWGLDQAYTIEQVANMSRIYDRMPIPCLVDWWKKFYVLKTHLTLPKKGIHTTNAFDETCSPTDMNFRTRFYTHKSGLTAKVRDVVPYADLWVKPTETPREPWPCLDPEPFTRVIDKKFFFINTPAYYAVCYGGPTSPDWVTFGKSELKDGSGRVLGYGGAGYGGHNRKATKVGGLSAVYVRNCGPVLLGQNHDVMYANVVWGRRKTPISETWDKTWVDPTIVCSGFAHPYTEFDKASRLYRKVETLRFAPLTVTRTIHLKDDRIDVTVRILATDDLRLTELYECIPYFAENREAALFDETLKPAGIFAIPECMNLGRKPSEETVATFHEREKALPAVTARAISFTGPSGAGATVIFDKAHEFRQSLPVKYRGVASPGGGLSLPLPHALKAGETHTVRYTVWPHDHAPTTEEIRTVAGEE